MYRARPPLRPASSMFWTSQSTAPTCVPGTMSVNVLVPALAKLAAQLVADLLIAAGPSTAALFIGHLLRAHAHAQHLLDLEARRWLSLWRTRRTRLATPLQQQHARLCAQPCTARLCSEGCLRSHAATHADPRSARSTPRRFLAPISIACQDGAQASAVNNLFLRSRLCSPRLGGVAQPSGHPRARCMHSDTLQSRAPRRSGAGNTRLMTAGRPQSSVHTGHQSLWLRSFRGIQGSI